jgi:amidase
MPEPSDQPEPREPLDRRAFLGHAAVLGAAAAGGLRPAAEGVSPSLGSAAPPSSGAVPATPAPAVAPFELEEITIAELQAGMASGRYTAKGVVQLYFDRIAAMDRTGVALQSIIETNPEALALAEALDQERAAKGARGPPRERAVRSTASRCCSRTTSTPPTG